MSDTTDLARRPAGANLTEFAAYLKRHKGLIAAVAANELDPERLLRIVYNAVARTPKLAQCTMGSIVRAVLMAAELGLEAGSGTGHAYLVPFGNEAQLIVGYRGLLDLVRRTGDVSSVTTNAVYEGDEFEIEFGIQDKLRHVPKADPDPAKLIAVYAIVRFRDGSHQLGYMTRKQIEAIRSRSRTANSGPWVTDYAEMARKTVLRNVLKYCPMSLQAAKAVSADVYADTGDPSLLAAFASEMAKEPEPEPQPRGKALAQRIKAREAAESTPEGPAPEPEHEHELSLSDSDGTLLR